MDKYQRIAEFLEDPTNEPFVEGVVEPVQDEVQPMENMVQPIQDSVQPTEGVVEPVDFSTLEPLVPPQKEETSLIDYKKPRFTQEKLDLLLNYYAQEDPVNDPYGHEGFAKALMQTYLVKREGIPKENSLKKAEEMYKAYRDGSHPDVAKLKKRFGESGSSFRGLTADNIIHILADDVDGKPLGTGNFSYSVMREAIPQVFGLGAGVAGYNVSQGLLGAGMRLAPAVAQKLGLSLATGGMGAPIVIGAQVATPLVGALGSHIGGYVFGDNVADKIYGKRETTIGGPVDDKKRGEVLAASLLPSLYGLSLGTRVMRLSPSFTNFLAGIGQSSAVNKKALEIVSTKGFLKPNITPEQEAAKLFFDKPGLSQLLVKAGIDIQENATNPLLQKELSSAAISLLSYITQDVAGATGASIFSVSDFAQHRGGSGGEKFLRETLAEVFGDLSGRGLGLIGHNVISLGKNKFFDFLKGRKALAEEAKAFKQQQTANQMTLELLRNGENLDEIIEALLDSKNKDLTASQATLSPTMISFDQELDLIDPDKTNTFLRNTAKLLQANYRSGDIKNEEHLRSMMDFAQSIYTSALQEKYLQAANKYVAANLKINDPKTQLKIEEDLKDMLLKMMEDTRSLEHKKWSQIPDFTINNLSESATVNVFESIIEEQARTSTGKNEFFKSLGGDVTKEGATYLSALKKDIEKIKARIIPEKEQVLSKLEIIKKLKADQQKILQTNVYAGGEVKHKVAFSLEKVLSEIDNKNLSPLERAEVLEQKRNSVLEAVYDRPVDPLTGKTSQSIYSQMKEVEQSNFNDVMNGWKNLVKLNSSSSEALFQKNAQKYVQNPDEVDELDPLTNHFLIDLRKDLLAQARKESKKPNPNTEKLDFLYKMQAAILEDLDNLPTIMGEALPNREAYDNARAFSLAINESFLGKRKQGDRLLDIKKIIQSPVETIVEKHFKKNGYGIKLQQLKEAGEWVNKNVYSDELAKDLNIENVAPMDDADQQAEVLVKLLYRKLGKTPNRTQQDIKDALIENKPENLENLNDRLLSIDDAKINNFLNEYSQFFDNAPELKNKFKDVESTRKVLLDVLVEQSNWNKALEGKKAFYMLTRKGDQRESLNSILDTVVNGKNSVRELDNLVDEIDKIDLDQALKQNPDLNEADLKELKRKARQSLKTGIIDYALFKGGIDLPPEVGNFNPATTLVKLMEPLDDEINKGRQNFLDWMISKDLMDKGEARLLVDNIGTMTGFLAKDSAATGLLDSLPEEAQGFIKSSFARLGGAKTGIFVDKILGIGSPLVSAGIMSSEARALMKSMSIDKSEQRELIQDLMTNKKLLADLLVVSKSDLKDKEKLSILKDYTNSILNKKSASNLFVKMLATPLNRAGMSLGNRSLLKLQQPGKQFTTLQEIEEARREREARAKATEEYIKNIQFRRSTTEPYIGEDSPKIGVKRLHRPPTDETNVRPIPRLNLNLGVMDKGIATQLSPKSREILKKDLGVSDVSDGDPILSEDINNIYGGF